MIRILTNRREASALKRSVRIAGWVVVWLTALFFLQNGIQKLIGVEQMVELFRELGYPDGFRIAVGLLEAAGGIVLAIPRFTLYAAMLLGVLMAGAVASEAINGRIFEALIPAQWLIVFVLIIYVRIRSGKKQRK